MSAYTGVIDLPGPVQTPDCLLERLASEVCQVCQQPVDVLQVAALLETAGITDSGACLRYGHASVFDLAHSVMQHLPGYRASNGQHLTEHATLEPRWQATLDYLRGPLTLLPMVLLSAVIMIYQQFGQWSAITVLAMSVAVVGSLLVTSGFVQAASRKGSSYLSQGYILAAQRIIGRIVVIGLAAVCLTTVLLTLAAKALLAAEPGAMMTLAIAFVVLSCLWLAAGVLFMLNQVHWFGAGLAVGVAMVWLLLRGLALVLADRNVTMLAATAAGSAAALLVMAAVVRSTLARRMAASSVGAQRVVLPAMPHLLVNLAPYFIYGVLYVLLVLAGHVVGWVGRAPATMDRMTAVATTEVGLTIALGGMILASGVAERTVARFWRLVKVYQQQVSMTRPADFSQRIRSFYRRELRRYLAAVVVCSALVVTTVLTGVAWFSSRGVAMLPWNEATLLFMLFGAAGYAIMAAGVFQCMFMITLSRPGMASQAVLIGIAVTLAAGIIIGQLGAYQHSGLGLVLGSLAFSLAARSRLDRLLGHTDFYYYASF